ncbi:MAG: transporter substrate-binding domain-containing protein [Bulleidia sp.]
MNRFMKITTAALACTMMFGCSSGNKASAASDTTADTKTITIGISPDYAPYESLTKDGEIVGFDPDMVAMFEEYLNEDGQSCRLEFVQMDFDNIIVQIQGDQIDLGISGFSYDEKREVEWSKPYLGSSQVAIMPGDTDIASADDLAGKKIAVQTGSTGEEAANQIEGAEVVGLKSVQDIMNALSAHQYDAAIIDGGVAKNYVANGDYKMIDEPIVDEKNYIIAKKGNTEIIDLMNKCIDRFVASDDYAKMCEEYGLTPVEAE